MPSSTPAYKPLSSEEIDLLVGAIADRHGFLLNKNDAIFVTVTLHELVIERLLRRAEETAEAAKREIGSAAQVQLESAKSAASELITQAAEYADEQFRLAAIAAAAELKNGFLKELHNHPLVIDAERVAAAASTARWSMAVSIMAASITALVAIGFPLVFGSAPPIDRCSEPSRQIVSH